MNSNETRIVLTDETSDGRFLKDNTGDSVMEAATGTETEKAVTAGSTPAGNKANPLKGKVMNKIASKSPLGSLTGLAGGALTTQTVVLTALSVMSKMYLEWKRENDKVTEINQLRLRAGGDRGQSNIMNQRVGLVTGIARGGSGTYVRR